MKFLENLNLVKRKRRVLRTKKELAGKLENTDKLGKLKIMQRKE